MANVVEAIATSKSATRRRLRPLEWYQTTVVAIGKGAAAKNARRSTKSVSESCAFRSFELFPGTNAFLARLTPATNAHRTQRTFAVGK
jgi:hypothetical protein